MAKEWRIPFEEFTANITDIFERLRRTDKKLLVETDQETIVMHRAETDVDDIVVDDFVLADADYAEFCAAAGSWSDVDTDALLKDIYADRERISDRPPVKL